MNFLHTLGHAARNLAPIVLVVAVFQALVLRTVPDGLVSIVVGLAIVVLGVAVFLQGLEMGIFPIGKNLSNALARRGSLLLLMAFGFALGFAAVIAEPALIAVAEQAELISEGRIEGFLLRLIVALSVGVVVALGILRTVLGHPLHWYILSGYVLVVLVTFFAPEEIVGLAYDSGGVTTNIVTVPLVAALGLGLAASISGRNPLRDGFGLVALAVMVPMVTVQIYGIIVFAGADIATPAVAETAVMEADTHLAGAGERHWVAAAGMDLLSMLRDVAPIIAVIAVFQYFVLRKRIPWTLPALVDRFVVV